jgi:hypothetical protein
MQESIINLTKDKNMSDVLCGKVWFGAFEDGNEVVCVANFDMPVEKVPVTTNDWVCNCEKIYRATQNIMDSWSLTLEQINNESKDFGRPLDKKEDGADWISPKNFYRNYGHRSMSCGDVVQFGRDDREKTYWAVASFGFVELTYDEYSEWHDMSARDRSWFIDDIQKAYQHQAKYKEEVAC